MHLSAVRFLKDIGSFKAGDIVPIRPQRNVISGPCGTGKTTLLRCIAAYHVDAERDTIECNYDNDVENSTDIRNGVVYVDFMSTPPVVKGNLSSQHMDALNDLAQDNKKADIISYMIANLQDTLILLDEAHSVLHQHQCYIRRLNTVPTYTYYAPSTPPLKNQVLETCANPDYLCSSCYSTGNKAWVSERHIRCARALKRLTERLQHLDRGGFVARVDARTIGYKGFLYLMGKSLLTYEATCAHIYKTRLAAEKAIATICASPWPPQAVSCLRDAQFSVQNAHKLSASSYEIIPVEAFESILFGGPVTPLNTDNK